MSSKKIKKQEKNSGAMLVKQAWNKQAWSKQAMREAYPIVRISNTRNFERKDEYAKQLVRSTMNLEHKADSIIT